MRVSRSCSGKAVRHVQGFDDSARLAVERNGRAGLGIKDSDANGRGIYEGFQADPGSLLLPVAARVGDDERGLGGETLRVFPRLQW